jgi:endo-1,4-beta-xylanase
MMCPRRSGRSIGIITSCFAAVALAACAGSVGGEGGSGGTTITGAGGSTGGGGTGGTSGTGGSTGTGGLTGSGGVTGSGGSTGSGGTTGTGGVTGTGGTAGSSGGTGSGGSTGTGGATGSGGSTGTGGATGSGGSTGSGGTTGTGGTSGACTAGAPWTGGRQYSSNTQGNVGNGYSYQLWSNGTGSGSMTVAGVDAKFSATWNNVGDFLARVGLGWNSTQTFDQLGTISADYAYTRTGSGGGFSYIGIYGWSVSPLVEYYIVDDWFGSRPTGGGTKVGTFTVDGGTYDVYQHTQMNQPSITGSNATFPQFFSVRQAARQCGHISITQHFKEWATLGLTLGKMEEARILVEVGGGNGTINFTTATVTAN